MGLANAIKKGYSSSKKIVSAKRITSETGNHKGILVGCLLLIPLLLVMAYISMIAAPLSITSSITHYILDVHNYYTEEEIEEIVSDAGSLRMLLLNPTYDPYAEELVYIDKLTLLRILSAVDDYNQAVKKEHSIAYEYRIEKAPQGMLPEINDITGEVGAVETGVGYQVSYETDSVILTRAGIDRQSRADGRYEDIFYLNWQPVVALCSLYIQGNVANWGTYGNSGNGNDNFYLSDAEIDRIIDVFAYTYVYKRDVTLNRNTLGDLLALSFDSFMESGGSGFKTRYFVTSQEIRGEVWDVRETRRIPCIAPSKIFNSYITYEYKYEEKDSGRYLTERSILVEPQKLLDKMDQIVPKFYKSWYLFVLKQMPYAQDQYEYYKDIVFREASESVTYSSGAAISETADQISECPAIKTYLYGVDGPFSGSFWGDYSGTTPSGEDTVIRLYAGNGQGGRYIYPGEWIVEEGNDYGSFVVSAAAMRPLDEKDNLGIGLSVLQIEQMLTNYPFSESERTNSPLLNSLQAVRDTAACLYAYQEETGTSICGLLGIMKQEGGIKSTIAVRGWNFFNISVGTQTTYGGISGYERFRDYRSVFEGADGVYETDAVNALTAQINWINNNYWSNSHSQNTYYRMCFMGYDESDPQNAYAGIFHSYCPPWDDTAMPYSQDSYIIYNGENRYYWKNAGEGNRGWVNGCARLRSEFEEYTRFQVTMPDIPMPEVSVPIASMPPQWDVDWGNIPR